MKINTRTDAVRAERASRNNELVVSVKLEPLLENLEAWKAGYPTGLDGTGSDDLTTVERLASIMDKASTLEREVFDILARRLNDSVRLAQLCTMFGNTAVKPTKAADDLSDLDKLWCRNCATHGIFQPKRQDGSVNCDWCMRFARANDGVLPPRKLVIMHSEGRNLTEAIVARSLGRQAS